MSNKIKKELEDAGYDYAIAVATLSEIENGAACGQLSIITENILHDDVLNIKYENNVEGNKE